MGEVRNISIATTLRRMQIQIDLDETERAFMLHRLCAVSAVAHAVGRRIGPNAHRQVVERCWCMAQRLRDGGPLTVASTIDQALVVESIEGNQYFTDRSRVIGDHLRRADRLRARLSDSLGCTIRRFPVAGNTTPPEAA